MKKGLKKFIVSMVAAATIAVPMTNQVMPAFIDAPPAIVMMEADAATKKRSGKSKAYISSLVPGKMSFTICLNTDKDINTMIKCLESLSYWTSGCKNGALVVKLGKTLFAKDKVSRKALDIAAKMFMNGNGVSKSAGKAAKSLKSLAYKKNNLNKGVKVTMGQKDWLTQLQ